MLGAQLMALVLRNQEHYTSMWVFSNHLTCPYNSLLSPKVEEPVNIYISVSLFSMIIGYLILLEL